MQLEITAIADLYYRFDGNTKTNDEIKLKIIPDIFFEVV